MKKNLIGFLFAAISFFSTSSFAQGDDCTNATYLNNVSNFCSGNGFYTNVPATASLWATATCWPVAATRDVWFMFTAIGTDLTVTVSGVGSGGGTINSPSVVLYSGNCATVLTEQACANGPAATDLASLYKGALAVGTVYYIRVSSTNANMGTFELCVNSYNPPLSASADCAGASLLCDKSPVSNISLSGGGTNPNEPIGTCLDLGIPIESNSAWYYWTCGTSGTLTFDITPFNATDDIDWVLYQLNSSNPCGGGTEIRCNAASCLNATGSTGINASSIDVSESAGCTIPYDAYCSQINMTAGTSYALLVNNWSTSSGFSLSFGGTGTFQGPSANISASATSICAGQSVTFNGSGSANYSALGWNFGPGATPATATGPGPHVVTYSTPGTISAVLSASTALACPPDVKSVTFTVNPTPTVTVNNPATITCAASTSTVTATGGGSYSWSGPGVTGGASSASATVNQSGVYTVTVTTNGCSATNTVSVTSNTVVPNGSISTPQGTSLSCSTTSVSLQGNSSTGGVSFSWNGPSGAMPGNPVTATSGGTYTLTVTDPSNSCVTTQTVAVSPSAGLPNISTNSSSNTISCATPSVTLTGSTTTPNTTTGWSDSGGPIAGNPITVTTAGSYTFTVTDNGSNCTSTQVVNITGNSNIPNLSSTATEDTITCLSINSTLTGSSTTPGVTFSWSGTSGPIAGNPIVVTTADIYTLTVTDPSNGCTSTSTHTVVLNNAIPNSSFTTPQGTQLTCSISSVSLNGSSSSTGVTLTWFDASGPLVGNPYNATSAGTYTLVVVDPTSGCQSSQTVTVTSSGGQPNISTNSSGTNLTCTTNTLTLTGSTTTPNTTVSWNGPSGAIAGNPIVVSAAGTYTFTVVDNGNNCQSVQTVVVGSNVVLPTINATPTNGTLTCVVTSVNVSASSPTATTFTLTNSSGTSFTMPTSISISGTYTVTGTDPSNGCVNSTTVVISVDSVIPTASVTASATAITCVASPTLTASTNATNPTFAWQGPMGNMVGSPVTASVPGTYTLTVLDQNNGCTATDVVTVTTNSVSPNVNAGSTQNINCSTNTAVLSGSSTTSGASFSWSGPGGFSSSVASPTVTAIGAYTLTVTDPANGCTANAVVNVNNPSGPNVNAGPNQTINCNGNVTLNGSSSTAGATFSWSGPGIVSGGSTATPTVNVNGTYTLTVTDPSNGCTSSSTVVVSGAIIPVSNPTANPSQGPSPLSVNFDGSGSVNAATYSWYIPDNPPVTTNLMNTSYVFNTPGSYNVLLIVTSSSGCVDTGAVTVIVEEPFNIVIPNVFSPNNDNINDLFNINASGLKDLKCDIFNRWGTKVVTLGLNQPWNGKLKNGNQASEGTYYYMIKVTKIDGNEEEFKGTLTLLE